MLPTLLTAAEAAVALNLRKSRVYQLVEDGTLPCERRHPLLIRASAIPAARRRRGPGAPRKPVKAT